jgi:hypothetical protein
MADEATTATETTETGTTAATAAATGATTETTSNGADTGAATGAEATETTAGKTDTEETTALGAAGKSAAIPEILGAPEGDYEVKAPEGKDFDKEAFDAVAPALKELNLSNKGAQAIVDVYADKLLPLIEQRVTKQIEERSQLATAEYRKQWLDDAKADPEIGGGTKASRSAPRRWTRPGSRQATPSARCSTIPASAIIPTWSASCGVSAR